MQSEYNFITLRDRPELMDRATTWFNEKWRVPKEAYLECMTAYLNRETEYGWYLCLSGERIVGGLGVIENDFHNRKDLTPNVCAVYTEADCRCQGIAGRLLSMVVEDMRAKGIAPLYLITNHNRVLRALRLGIPLHGAGRWGTGDDKDVYSSVKQS